ncbi:MULTISPECIES: hypothetical protein [unclassified Streptomyces]|uniref:hypothetical protein n=1 Tax=unclassified Streptomyces TaxID=2593676 RepID=UPI0024A93EC9|nr:MULTISPECIES: hypothetical protein [unclassified Streptomyces]
MTGPGSTGRTPRTSSAALDGAQRLEVEAIAQRIADAVGVRRIGKPFDITESVSGVRTFAEAAVMVWYQEDYRDDVVLVLRAQHFGVQHLES